jgi:hypothetical protein
MKTHSTSLTRGEIQFGTAFLAHVALYAKVLCKTDDAQLPVGQFGFRDVRVAEHRDIGPFRTTHAVNNPSGAIKMCRSGTATAATATAVTISATVALAATIASSTRAHALRLTNAKIVIFILDNLLRFFQRTRHCLDCSD